MKKISALLLFSFIFVATLPAQTPQHYNYQVVEGTNYFPFGVVGGKEVQWLYPAGNFNTPTPAPSGNITKVYFYMGYTNGNATLTDLLIKLGQTTLTNLPVGQIYTGTLDTVFFKASINLISHIGQWMEIDLDTPFPYDSTKSLVVDVSQCGATNNSVVVCQHSYGGQRRNYINGTTSCVFTYSGQDGNAANFGVDISQAPPAGWTAQTSGVTTSLYTVSAVDRNVGWIGGASGVVLRTTNGGTNWTNVSHSPIGTAAVYAICGISANVCMVSTSPSATYVYRTTNGGANWTQVFTQTGGFMDDIKFQNANTGFMYGDPVGGRWSLWKSTNGGANWDSTGLHLPQAGTEAGWNNSMWLVGNNLWFGTNNTRVYYSTNLGSSWNYGVTTGSANSYSVAFNSGGIGFTGQSVTLKSTNGGANYSTVTLPGTGTCYSFNNVLDRFWYDRGSSIYWSSNNGANFSSQYTGTGTYQAMSLKLDGNVIRGWSVTSAGGIAAYYEMISGIENNHNQIPSDYSLSQNYPNPFNPSTKISYSLPQASNVRLVVFDLLGREVATLVDGYMNAGVYTVDFNASTLASGVYVYRIEAGNFTSAKKMMLIK